jgi:hypothetical protein
MLLCYTSYCTVPVVVMEKGFVPAAIVGIVMGVSAPPAPIEYCETLVLPQFATWVYLPKGSTVTEGGLLHETRPYPPASLHRNVSSFQRARTSEKPHQIRMKPLSGPKIDP